MEDLLINLLQQAPNIGVALAALWWQARTIQRPLEVQIDLLDRFTRLAANGTLSQPSEIDDL